MRFGFCSTWVATGGAFLGFFVTRISLILQNPGCIRLDSGIAAARSSALQLASRLAGVQMTERSPKQLRHLIGFGSSGQTIQASAGLPDGGMKNCFGIIGGPIENPQVGKTHSLAYTVVP
jgi:hypothetical protein